MDHALVKRKAGIAKLQRLRRTNASSRGSASRLDDCSSQRAKLLNNRCMVFGLVLSSAALHTKLGAVYTAPMCDLYSPLPSTLGFALDVLQRRSCALPTSFNIVTHIADCITMRHFVNC
eukprot:9484506-Pyramimonas_sp.AAC.1